MAPSRLMLQTAFEPIPANAIVRVSPTSPNKPTSTERSFKSMSRVANVARDKLQREEFPEDHDLRYLVGHLNLLDVLASLVNDQKDPEATEDVFAEPAGSLTSKLKQTHTPRLATITEELDFWDDSLSDGAPDDASDISEVEFGMQELDLDNIKSPPTTVSLPEAESGHCGPQSDEDPLLETKAAEQSGLKGLDLDVDFGLEMDSDYDPDVDMDDRCSSPAGFEDRSHMSWDKEFTLRPLP